MALLNERNVRGAVRYIRQCGRDSSTSVVIRMRLLLCENTEGSVSTSVYECIHTIEGSANSKMKNEKIYLVHFMKEIGGEKKLLSCHIYSVYS